jgi:hypothetical protein
LRSELLRSVKPVQLKSPPVISPQKKEQQPKSKIPKQPKPQSEIVRLIKVIPEYRMNERSRLTIVLVSFDDVRAMPKLRFKPGMFVEMTIKAYPPKKAKTAAAKEGKDEKK